HPPPPYQRSTTPGGCPTHSLDRTEPVCSERAHVGGGPLMDDSQSSAGAVGALVDPVEFAVLRGGERDEAIMGYERLIRRLQGVQADLVREVQRSQSYTDDGHRSVQAWLRQVLNAKPATATRIVALAGVRAQMPNVAVAHSAGLIGPDQMTMLGDMYRNPR